VRGTGIDAPHLQLEIFLQEIPLLKVFKIVLVP